MRKTTLFFIVLFIVLSVPTLRAQTLTTLYNFKNSPDSRYPVGHLLRDRVGNLYSAAARGGSTDWGTIFKIDPAGNETVLYNFGLDTQGPSSLTMDSVGNFYGTTYTNGGGYGSVFELDASGNFVVVHTFDGIPDGEYPASGLILDKTGNLYGITQFGGALNFGTLFEVDAAGHETVLHSFSGSPDGMFPVGDLVMDKRGNLYGTTWSGGSFEDGTVFKVDTAGHETILHNFTDSEPRGPDGLVDYSAGNLYGTTGFGGAFNAGTAFKLDKRGHITVLHSFPGNPDTGGLGEIVRDKTGNLYGGQCYIEEGDNRGIVFKVDRFGHETVLHSFTGGPDGACPGSLTTDERGTLYGTTLYGGAFGNGTVFKLTLSDCDEHQGFAYEVRHDSDSDNAQLSSGRCDIQP